ncbi:antibiotic biosynthesis monooxygenase family protein [Streptomyces sp. SCSIO 30461]|uniref:antibiotic biosynthesis monooxygenase family protein n=1 Tax=Streptomyces sp. SCSIO 30461 TaxID=3118085 RepID=UPI0030D5E53A
MRLLHVREGMEDGFVRAYKQVRRRAAASPGHLSEQLCRSAENPAQWLLTSEWEDMEAIKRWRLSSEHEALVQPMNACLLEERTTTVFNVVD